MVHKMGVKAIAVLLPHHRPCDFIANEQQERLKQIPDPAARTLASHDVLGEPIESQNDQHRGYDFQHHELGHTEPARGLVQIPQAAQRLRNQNLAGQRLVVTGDLLLRPIRRFGEGLNRLAARRLSDRFLPLRQLRRIGVQPRQPEVIGDAPAGRISPSDGSGATGFKLHRS